MVPDGTTINTSKGMTNEQIKQLEKENKKHESPTKPIVHNLRDTHHSQTVAIHWRNAINTE